MQPRRIDKLRDFLSEPDVEEPVRRLGKYVLGRVLGRGGMGVVYEAEDPELKRRIALKILRGDEADARVIRRLHREAAIAAQLQHPNIVTVHEVGMVLDAERRPVHFIAMEFVEGPTFGEWLRARRPAVPEFLEAYQDIVRGVAFAHARGVVHRDLKPANLLLGKDGRVKLTDFGLARAEVFESQLTQSNAVMGTPAYMAPEQVEGRTRDVDPRSDVYALGVILYEGLTGRSPYAAATQADLYRQILEAEFERPREITQGISRDLERICLKAMERFPADRYATAAELADDVARFRAGEPILARGTHFLYRLKKAVAKRRTGVIGCAAAILAIAGTALVFRARESERIRREAERERAAAVDLSRAREYRALRRNIAPVEEDLRETRQLSYIPNADLAAALRRTHDALRRLEGIEEPEIAILRGLGWYFLGDLDRAEAALIASRDPQAEYLLGRIALDRSVYGLVVRDSELPSEKIRASQEWAARAVEHFSRGRAGDDALARDLARAYEELALGRDDSVRVLCAEGLARHGNAPGTEEFHNLLGILAKGKDRVDAYTEALKRRPHYAWAFFMRASAHHELRDYDAARADLEKALDLHPRFTPAYLDLGTVRVAQGDLRDAVWAYSKAIEIDPGLAGAWNNRGIVRFELGDREGAFQDFEEALRRKPRDVATLLNRGHAYLRCGRVEDALGQFEEARAVHPGEAEVHFGRGLCLTKLQQHDRAVEAYTTALSLRPDHRKARLHRGLAEVVRRDARSALSDLDAVLYAEPSNWEALSGRTLVWCLLRDLDRVIQDARATLRHAPADWAERSWYENILRDAEAGTGND